MGFFNKFKSKFEQAVQERKHKPAGEAKKDKVAKAKKGVVPEISEPVSKEAKSGARTAYRILVRPLVSEKTAALASDGRYVFVVSPDASKIEVKKAVQEVYGIMPTEVNIINVRGKAVRFGHQFGKRKNWKKAMVTLPKGKTLPIYE